MSILTRIARWSELPLSQVVFDLTTLGYTIDLHFYTHACESGVWIQVKIEKDEKTWRLGGSRLDIARDRLIAWADRQGIRVHRPLVSYTTDP